MARTDLTRPIIFFDGTCGLCNGFVNWMMNRDKEHIYYFAALQGKTAASLLKPEYTLDLDTIVLYKTRHSYYRSGAVLRAVSGLGGFWSVASIFLAVPRPIRNWVYRYVAKNRYRWFGQKEQCRIPTAEERSRILE